MYNRPWGIWWDFIRTDGEISHISIETNHPQHEGWTIHSFKIEEILVDGYVDEWEDKIYRPFVQQLTNGNISMKDVSEKYFENKMKEWKGIK